MHLYTIKRVVGYAIVAFIAFLLMLLFFSIPAQADVFVFGSLDNYTPVILPNGSYVHQGENISQGNYYDLSGVYGWSGILANWNDDYDNAGITNPDHAVTLDTRNLYSTYIDPNTFPVGRWYQFDGGIGCYGGSSNTNSNGGTILGATPTPTYSEADLCTNGFGNGNAFVFTVYPQAGVPDTGKHKVVHTSYMTILQGGSSVQVPVTYTEFETPVPTPPASVPQPDATVAPQDMASAVQPPAGDVQDVNGYNIPGGAAGAVQVTASAPVPVWVPVFAVLVVLVVMRRRK